MKGAIVATYHVRSLVDVESREESEAQLLRLTRHQAQNSVLAKYPRGGTRDPTQPSRVFGRIGERLLKPSVPLV